MEITYPVVVERIYVSNGHDFKGRFGQEPLRHHTPSVDSAECIAGKGIIGDRYFGYKDNWKGQITFITRETIAAVSEKLGKEEIDAKLFRRNVVVSGIDLNTLIGKTFRLGSAVFRGSEECAPCIWMDEVVQKGAKELMKGRGGLRCRIVESGTIRLGECELEVFV